MTHLTLNTGHSAERTPCDPHALAALLPLVAAGGQIPGFAGFRVDVHSGPGAASFSIHRGRDIITLSMVAWTDDGARYAWTEIERLYLGLADRASGLIAANASPEMPRSLPWIATLLLPGMATQRPQDLSWIGDFEGCFAEALVANHTASVSS